MCPTHRQKHAQSLQILPSARMQQCPVRAEPVLLSIERHHGTHLSNLRSLRPTLHISGYRRIRRTVRRSAIRDRCWCHLLYCRRGNHRVHLGNITF